MRGLTTTVLLLLVLVGLGGYIYFVDSEKPLTSTETKAKAFEINADDIEEIQIAVTGGDTSTLKKVDDRWQLVDPVQAEADNSEVDNMASSLATLDVQRVVDEAPADLGQYGLSTPRLVVAFRAKGQQVLQRLQIGERTPTGGDVYVKRPDQARVFLVTSIIDETFRRSAFDLRDKTILKFDRDAITSLEITNATGTMQLERKGADWLFVKPVPMRADFAAVEGTVTSLTATLMQKYVADSATPAELAQYGLAKPSASATVVAGDTRVRLELGRTVNAETYARNPDKPAILMVAPTIVGDLNKPLTDYRRRDLFDLRTFSAKRLELTRGTETLVFEKSEKDGAETWKNASGATVDTGKVEDLLNKLASLRIGTFETGVSAALKTPALTVTANFGANKGENRRETVSLARSGTATVASRPDEPGSVSLEGAAPLDDIFKALDALK